MILTLINKNLKIILRSPFTILLLVLSPILLMLVIGYSYSGEILHDINIGIIGDKEDNIFGDSYYNHEYLYYQTTKDCVENMKLETVDLCIFFIPSYDNSGNLISANINYYVDVTRPLLSDYVIRGLNDFIDKKTQEISKKTVSDILGEIDETVEFLRGSVELLDSIEKNVTTAREQLDVLLPVIKSSISRFDQDYQNIKNKKLQLDNDINNLIIRKNNVKNEILELEEYLDDTENDIDNSVDLLSNLYNDLTSELLQKYGSGLISTINVLDDLSDNMDNLGDSLELLSMDLNSIDDIKQIQISMDELFNQIDQIDNNLEDFEDQLEVFHEDLKVKEKEIIAVNKQVKEKLSYFEDLSNRDASQITEPISKNYEPIFDGFKRVHQLAPTVIVLVLLFIGLLLSNVIVSLEINSRAYFRNLISPVPQRVFVMGLFFTSLLIILFQIIFLFIILNLFFGIEIIGNFIPLIIIIIHILIVFILLGIFLAYLFSSIQISILFTTFIMLFIFLLSNIIVPVELMPKSISWFISLNPLIIGENLIRKILFFNPIPFTLSILDLISFYIYSIFLLFLVSFASRRRKRKMF